MVTRLQKRLENNLGPVHCEISGSYLQQIKRSGRSCFPCSVKGCQARLFAQYCNRDKKMQDLEEPVLDQTSRFQHQDHLMADGTVHPIQVILLKYRRRKKETNIYRYICPTGWIATGRVFPA